MAYEKRLCILKQMKRGFSADGGPITGAVYAERLGTELTVTPRIAGLSPVADGRYVLVAQAGGMFYCFELRGNEALKAEEAPSIADGFSVLLCFLRGEAEPVAFGRCGNAPDDYLPLLKALSGRAARKRPVPVPMPPNQIPGAPSPQVPLAPAIPVPEEEEAPFRDMAAAKYNDEAIASTDYYRECASHADEGGGAESEEQKEGQGGGADETAVHPFRLVRGGLTYYNKIAAKLKEAFAKYPRDETLLPSIPHSEWVKTEQALLGVVYAEGVPRYLCVALKEEPPAEAKEASCFVPLSPYRENEGYFVVFQDADTGDYVKVEQG